MEQLSVSLQEKLDAHTMKTFKASWNPTSYMQVMCSVVAVNTTPQLFTVMLDCQLLGALQAKIGDIE